MKSPIAHLPFVTLVTPLTRKLASLAILASLATGCTIVSYTTPAGERFTRGSLGANTPIASLTFEAGTNGVRRVDLRGYQTDTAQTIAAATDAAVRAALTSPVK